MAKSKAAKAKARLARHNFEPRVENRRTRHDYAIADRLECGIQLMGSEVKSIRHGHVQLAGGYATIDPTGRSFVLHGIDIAPYPHAGPFNHDPKRPRQLLAHRREILKLQQETDGRGVTLVPTALYFKEGRIKVEIGVGVGKKTHDKRHDLKEREGQREIERAMTRKLIGADPRGL
ncbi:SsrA-binding protein SmpB [Phycisphaera mikurensis]|uniref:SsrA-binding protein n=1 Tax=Phycisphaera mikurensis (strain NBRC 102666 / KCTC 22515 / FYK2301M01) TaxID=1142394 RepID=I0IFG5_PHYMF|nr:SsrA-binding protein SmpB [Phycisphaera mikurensis]MBB6440605.1 SsrA-binding protein [Phycisphaera mikurensis]BAM04003.1 SsrA-binding protein [Phycisphaera mikurensis NBRC 102666]